MRSAISARFPVCRGLKIWGDGMFQVNEDLSIYLTRGDAAAFALNAQENKHAYRFPAGSVVRFKVFEKKDCGCVVLQKDFPVETASCTVEISLTETETVFGTVINKPTDYWYEVELNPFDNPQTIIGYDEDGPKLFRLFPAGKDVEPEPVPEEIPVVDPELDLTSQRPVENQVIARAFARVNEAVAKIIEELKMKLPIGGGTMKGDIAMGGKKVTGLGTPEDDTDAATKAYADQKLPLTGGIVEGNLSVNGDLFTAGDIVMNGNRIGGLKEPEWEWDATNKVYVDNGLENVLGITRDVSKYAQNVGAPANLLDNSYFGQTVNQYKVEGGQGVGYHVDRWYSNQDSLRVEPARYTYQSGSVVGVLKLTNTSINSGAEFAGVLSQQIEPEKSGYMRGRGFTFAVKQRNGELHVCSGVCSDGNIPEGATEADMIQFSADINNGYLDGIDVHQNGMTKNFEVRIKVTAGATVNILWAALYEGEYTADTLPAYQPKGYTAELMECRRYYQVISDSIKNGILSHAASDEEEDVFVSLVIPLQVNMLDLPAMTILEASELRTVTGLEAAAEFSYSSILPYEDGSVRVDLGVTNLSNANRDIPVAMRFSAVLDANL